MEILHKAPGQPRKLGILAATFNPPTRAHVALGEAALRFVDEVLLALPARLPHKDFSGATLQQRGEMLLSVARAHEQFSVGVAAGGLFVEIAREAKQQYPDCRIYLVCGRDAADRILEWDYGEPGFVEKMLEEFHLLVAPRNGFYRASEKLRHAVHELPLPNFDECSSTRARQGDWDLVPPEITDAARRIYARPSD